MNHPRPWLAAIVVAGIVGVVPLARAQTEVLDVTYGSTIDQPNSSSGGIQYLNEYRPVTSITTAEGEFTFDGPAAQEIFVRRGSGGPNFTTVLNQVHANGRAYGSAQPGIEELFLSNNLYQGLRNPFANGTTYLDSNIERIDFYLGDYTVQEGAGVVFFDLENEGNQGDGFRIAAFTDWNGATESPTDYANTGLLVDAGSYGPQVNSPSDNNSREYFRATYGNGDNLSGWAYTGDLGDDLGLVGVFVKFTDLGLEVGSTIQGFSIMAGDVTANTTLSLVDWTNSSVYKTNTDRNTWGNTDFMAFGAKIAQPIPEPSTYGAMLMGGLVALFAWRRWQRREPAGG